ncbi:MAG: isocitrate/isopropylmalate dehydrogenase family protein [Promethearchaeati archaeon SRVP18_Atabeyarchaeia-1]
MAKKVVAMGGDGVGPEVVNAACTILESMGLDIEITKAPCGEAAIKSHGTPLPDETKQLCDTADAILFGAVGDKSTQIITYLRWVLDTYANIRPVKYYGGVRSPLREPSGIDFVIVRENSEGLYPAREGDLSMLARQLPDYRDLLGRSFMQFGKGKFAIRVITEKGTSRIAKFACEYARRRRNLGFPGKLTCVTKSNLLVQSCGLFRKTVEDEVRKYDDLVYEHYYVDDAARRIIRYPKEMDVIVTSNMFGDILSDLAAEVVGGLGLAPSACVGNKHAYFEPVHGSAPKYAGKNMVNPTATILSAKMMLEHLGMQRPAFDLEKAVQEIYKKGETLTYDQGGNASTMDFAEAVLRKLNEQK